MGFANSIIGGAAALIRAAIKSPNYVPSSAGWTINKDGSSEFNNIIARGTVVTGNPAAGHVIIDNDGIHVYDSTNTLVAELRVNGATDGLLEVNAIAADFISMHADAPVGSGVQDLTIAPAIGFNSISSPTGKKLFLMGGGGAAVDNGFMERSTNGIVEPWISLVASYPAGWSTWPGFNDLEYRLDSTGRVWFRGLVQIAASNGTGVKFTMPAGYRPAVRTQLMIPLGTATDFSVMKRFDVATSGTFNMLTATAAVASFISFDGVSYSTV